MSDEELLAGELQEALSVDELYEVKDALADAGYHLDANLADGSFTIHPADDDGAATCSPGVDGQETGETDVVMVHEADDTEEPDVDDGNEMEDGSESTPADGELTAEQHEEIREAVDTDEIDSSGEDDADDEDENNEDDGNKSVMQQRADRLDRELEEGTAYSSRELAAIAFDIDEGEVGASERGTLPQIKDRAEVTLASTQHPDGGNKKLYYHGEKPAILRKPADDDQDEANAADAETETETVYTCDECGGEFDAPVSADPKYHDCSVDETSDDEASESGTGKNRTGARRTNTMTA